MCDYVTSSSCFWKNIKQCLCGHIIRLLQLLWVESMEWFGFILLLLLLVTVNQSILILAFIDGVMLYVQQEGTTKMAKKGRSHS